MRVCVLAETKKKEKGFSCVVDGMCVKCKFNPIVNKKQGTEPLRAIAPIFPFFFFYLVSSKNNIYYTRTLCLRAVNFHTHPHY